MTSFIVAHLPPHFFPVSQYLGWRRPRSPSSPAHYPPPATVFVANNKSSEQAEGVSEATGRDEDEKRAAGKGDGTSDTGDAAQPPLRYPWWVGLIVLFLICRAISRYGTNLSLVFYLKHMFLNRGYGWDRSEDYGSATYHALEFETYFVFLLGALVADSWLGYYHTILYAAIVHVLSCVLLSVASRPNSDQGIPGNPQVELTLVALVLQNFCAGMASPSSMPLAATQFKMPEQQQALQYFMGWNMMAMNVGVFLFLLVAPIVRVSGCYGEESCSSYVFDVAAGMMVLGTVVLLAGKRWFTIKIPERSSTIDFFKTVYWALRNRWRADSKKSKDHWLDYAKPQSPQEHIQDAKGFCRLLLLFLLDPVSGTAGLLAASRILLQVSHMDCKVGSIYLLPEHLHFVGVIALLIFTPLFMYLSPILDNKGLFATPLKKDVLFGFMFTFWLLGHALLEFEVEKSYPHEITGNMGRLSVFNGMAGKCRLKASFRGDELPQELPSMKVKGGRSKQVKDAEGLPALPFELTPKSLDIEVVAEAEPACGSTKAILPMKLERGKSSNAFFFQEEDGLLAGYSSQHSDLLKKSETGAPYLRIVYHLPGIEIQNGTVVVFSDVLERESFTVGLPEGDETGDTEAVFSREVLQEDGVIVCLKNARNVKKVCSHNVWFSNHQFSFKFGASYNVYIQSVGAANSSDGRNLKVDVETVVKPNRVHVIWSMLLMLFCTAGQAYSHPAMAFFYFSQTPQNLKATVQGVMVTLGSLSNLLASTLMASLSNVFKSQAHEFLMFAGISFFMSLPYRYYVWNYKYSEYDVPLPDHWPRTSSAEAKRKAREKEADEQMKKDSSPGTGTHKEQEDNNKS